ncbi:hypothetical protein ACRALDRAFT_2051703 [Sodiomyces alcalophilus JCM 7366]|uniref:uncharacterized protein n=1 Tax=Sodiomyces alcalophilus JCM 7366 TaxID=591952 RepID=UPI0039B4085C
MRISRPLIHCALDSSNGACLLHFTVGQGCHPGRIDAYKVNPVQGKANGRTVALDDTQALEGVADNWRGGRRVGDLPREDELSMGIIPEAGEAGFDMIYEGRRLPSLEVGDEPLGFIDAAGRSACPDTVTADYNQVAGVWWWHIRSEEASEELIFVH